MIENENPETSNGRFHRFRLWIIAGVACLIPAILFCFDIYGSYTWTFPLIAIWHFAYRKADWAELGVRPLGPLNITLALSLGIVSGIVIGCVGGLIVNWLELGGISLTEPTVNGQAVGSSSGFRLIALSESPIGWVGYFLYYIALVGLGEETLWRAIVQQQFKRFLNRHLAVLVTAFLFGLVHLFLILVLPLGKALILMAVIGLGGLIWGYLFEWLKNIWLLAISHGIASAIIWKYFIFA